jgi:hypothetical protein
MASLPSKAAARIAAGIRKFQPIVAAAKARDINESDTAVIVADMLQEICGYDKYSEITSEYAIRGTYCDIAVKLDGALAFLVEVKAVGLELKEAFVKQAVDYAANQGVDWVVLTNGTLWQVFRIGFGKPITQELVATIDFAALNPRSDADVELFYLVSKEGWQRSSLRDYHAQREALSRFSIAAIIVSDSIVSALRRELRRLAPDVRVSIADVRGVLENDVIKRDALEGERAVAAKRSVARAANKALRQTKETPVPEAIAAAPPASPPTMPS